MNRAAGGRGAGLHRRRGGARCPGGDQLGLPRHVIGVQTHRDHLVVARTRNELERRLAEFADSDIPDHVWEERGLASTDTWNLPKTLEALAVVAARNIIEWTYRPFDRRLGGLRRTTRRSHPHQRQPPDLVDDGEDGNLAIAFAYGSLTDGPYVTRARSPVPAGYVLAHVRPGLLCPDFG